MESGRSLEIFVVASEARTVAAVRDALSSAGMPPTMQVARNLHAARRLIETLRRPMVELDLILVDVGFDGDEGYDLVARIKADEHLSHVPVIGVSGSAELFECARVARVGAVACVRRAELGERLPALVARLDPERMAVGATVR